MFQLSTWSRIPDHSQGVLSLSILTCRSCKEHWQGQECSQPRTGRAHPQGRLGLILVAAVQALLLLLLLLVVAVSEAATRPAAAPGAWLRQSHWSSWAGCWGMPWEACQGSRTFAQAVVCALEAHVAWLPGAWGAGREAAAEAADLAWAALTRL